MACQDLASMSPTEVKTFFDSYDTVLTDCDGVLWKGKFTTLIHNFSNNFYRYIYGFKKIYIRTFVLNAGSCT